jgi:hypothetical protein
MPHGAVEDTIVPLLPDHPCHQNNQSVEAFPHVFLDQLTAANPPINLPGGPPDQEPTRANLEIEGPDATPLLFTHPKKQARDCFFGSIRECT